MPEKKYIARIAREQQQWELAQRAATLMISFDPNYFGAHYASALVAQHTGDEAKTQEEFATAKKLWAHADSDLPELSKLNATH